MSVVCGCRDAGFTIACRSMSYFISGVVSFKRWRIKYWWTLLSLTVAAVQHLICTTARECYCVLTTSHLKHFLSDSCCVCHCTEAMIDCVLERIAVLVNLNVGQYGFWEMSYTFITCCHCRFHCVFCVHFPLSTLIVFYFAFCVQQESWD